MTLRHAQSCNTILIFWIFSSSDHLQDNLFAEARNAFEYHEGGGARHHFSIHSRRALKIQFYEGKTHKNSYGSQNCLKQDVETAVYHKL